MQNEDGPFFYVVSEHHSKVTNPEPVHGWIHPPELLHVASRRIMSQAFDGIKDSRAHFVVKIEQVFARAG